MKVESVAWVSERKDVLSTLFWLAAILGYVRYTERRTWRRYAAVCVWMELSLLSKGMAVTLPFTLLLLDYWPLRRWSPPAAGTAPRNAGLLREKLLMPSSICWRNSASGMGRRAKPTTADGSIRYERCVLGAG